MKNIIFNLQIHDIFLIVSLTALVIIAAIEFYNDFIAKTEN
jgi:hypothetical protein